MRGRRRLSPAAPEVWFVALLTSAHTAAAPVDSALHVDTTACQGQPTAAAFLKALQVELADPRAWPEHALGRDEPSLPPPLARIVVCALAQGRVVLAVGEKVTTIDVSDVPTVAQARTAAVAVGETLRWWRLPATKRVELSEGVQSKDASPELPGAPAPASERPIAPAAYEEPNGTPSLTAGELVLVARGAGRGPEHSLLWGGEMRGGWRVTPYWLAGLAAGYLTTSHAAALGSARLHGVTLGLTLDRVWTLPAAYSEWRLGLGFEGMHSTAVIQSNWGFEEPTVRRVNANVNAHLSFVGAIDATWFVVTSIEASRAVLGVAFQAGSRDAISLYGWGLDARVGVGHRF